MALFMLVEDKGALRGWLRVIEIGFDIIVREEF
jgi:hypothetical protein